MEGLVNPSFLALNRAGDRLYTVHGDQQEVSALRVGADGRIELLNTIDCKGRNPVHLALDPQEQRLVVSNHLSGALALISVGPDGALGEVTQLTSLPGQPGPHRVEQPFSKPHFNPFDPSGRFVVVPDKGLDRIFSFRFASGKLAPAECPWVDTREGAGPRNVAFNPHHGIVYATNELDSTVTTYRFDATTGGLHPLQVLPSLPETFTGDSRAAAIEVSADGRYVYVSNRGGDSIAVFRADCATGLLSFVSAEPSGGHTPRFFTLAPGGSTMYVLNENSDSIVRFSVSAATGALTPAGKHVPCGSPVCMVFRTGR
jgi:6-phosphogluconolactonase (cycloisomerase 2 family)